GEAIGVVVATLNPLKVLAESGGGLPQNVNFAIKTGPIREFLAAANLTPAAPPADPSAEAFESARKSLALVRAGNVTEQDLKQPALFCRCSYASTFDMWFRFRVFQIVFFDAKKGDAVFKAGQYRDDMISSED